MFPSLFSFAFLYLILIACFKFYLNLCELNEYVAHFFETSEQEVYDYIIVGSGTAGSIIAHHLSTHKNIKFLVLEAGGFGGSLLNPPALGPLLHGTSYDWQYETVDQQNACKAMSGKCKWPAGKIVGGSAKLNNLIYLRGYVDEMVSWFNGKYSITQLNKILDELEKTDLLNEPLNYKTELSSSVLNAAKELGFKVGDLNKIRMGFMETVVNQKNGARWSTSSAFLEHNLKNGKIISNAVVKKIVMNIDFDNIDSVLYEKFGKEYHVSPRKGIILAAGTMGTSKLLLLSGIGPKKHLNNLNIPVVKDLPVGYNLMDHVTTGLDLILIKKPLHFNLYNFTTPTSGWDYFYNGKGPWTSVGCEVIATLNTCDIKSNSASEYCDRSALPDLQLMVMPTGISTDQGVHLHKTFGIKNQIWDEYFSKLTNMNAISILPVVLHPKSRGVLRLRSKNPLDSPIINPNYFSHSDDIKVIIKGIELIKQLISTKPMKSIGAELNTNLFPGCHFTEFDTPLYWECYAKHLTLTSYHPAGTCQMGDPGKVTTVVGYDFRVLGVKNLYVADASLFPSMPSGNINTAVALLAKILSNELTNKP